MNQHRFRFPLDTWKQKKKNFVHKSAPNEQRMRNTFASPCKQHQHDEGCCWKMIEKQRPAFIPTVRALSTRFSNSRAHTHTQKDKEAFEPRHNSRALGCCCWSVAGREYNRYALVWARMHEIQVVSTFLERIWEWSLVHREWKSWMKWLRMEWNEKYQSFEKKTVMIAKQCNNHTICFP